MNVEWRRRVGNRKGVRNTHEQVEETTATHVYCLWLQEVIHLEIWTSFGCVLGKGKGMGTDHGVLGGGRVRKAVAQGKQSEGDDSFRPCCMKAVRGRVYARTTTLGSTRCMRYVWQRRTSMECRGPRSVRMRLGGGTSSVLSSRWRTRAGRLAAADGWEKVGKVCEVATGAREAD